MCTLFEEGSEKVYALYTYLNIDIYGQPLMFLMNTNDTDINNLLRMVKRFLHGAYRDPLLKLYSVIHNQ